MKALVLLITGAVLPYLFDATLPSLIAAALLFVCVVLALNRSLRFICLLPAGFLLTTLAINHRLELRLPDSQNKGVFEVTGVIDSLPMSGKDYLSFIFLSNSKTPGIPDRLRVYWHENTLRDKGAVLPQIHAGERWQLQLELRTTRGRVNFHGVDAEKWLFADGIAALAYVKAGENVLLDDAVWFNLQRWRESMRERLDTVAGEVPAFRMLVALAIADRRSLLKQDRDLFSATGTGHLLAISGLHVGLAAVLGFYLGRVTWLMLPYGLAIRSAVALPWFTAWLAALCYSALAGFGVSTQRALIMLTVATVVNLARRRIHPAQAWLIAMAIVLINDPLAPIRAGFWFSFAAVGILLMLFTPRNGKQSAIQKMLLAQFGISLIMAPLGMYWFQQASLPGLLANLVAIPLVSFLIVPFILVGMLVSWMPGSLAYGLLYTAGFFALGLYSFLDLLVALQPAAFSVTRSPGLVSTVLAMFGALLIMLPRGMPLRCSGILLMLPMFLLAANPLAKSESRVDMLDVGQGLSVLVGSRSHLMVYDTGPGNGQQAEAAWHMVDGTIQPMIAARGLKPDLIVASHADLDHAGGLARLRDIYPQAEIIASQAEKTPGISLCKAPASWRAGGLEFNILHPSKGLPYLGNDSSCVISVNGLGLGLLLSGDISRAVEQRLAGRTLGKHALLTVPHHGSSTSSSQALIDAVMPELVMISAAYKNRFNFPREDVMTRYQNSNTQILNTAKCGGIRITTGEGQQPHVETARVTRSAIWRWPAGPGCP